jgi:hypothetical protein
VRSIEVITHVDALQGHHGVAQYDSRHDGPVLLELHRLQKRGSERVSLIHVVQAKRHRATRNGPCAASAIWNRPAITISPPTMISVLTPGRSGAAVTTLSEKYVVA